MSEKPCRIARMHDNRPGGVFRHLAISRRAPKIKQALTDTDPASAAGASTRKSETGVLSAELPPAPHGAGHSSGSHRPPAARPIAQRSGGNELSRPIRPRRLF